ncbi:MAG: Gfo/Idh/MocA family oxidoreductase [Leptospiraceae bacterium]|nr:Gfo/Idh/MocA family oxidoreductase [Leptospiraceae bacterium]NUM42960.1 Gfo/Idh/MocA family oxidoreductase [Leptospiraceae bacterium]
MNRVAVVGLGNISKRHRANIKKLYPESEVVAISASGKNSSQEVSNLDKYYSNLKDSVEKKIDMAIIASPATLHAEHANFFIRLGIPVLIEKPLTSSEIDSQSIVESSEKFQIPVAINYCLRYLSSSQKILSLLKEERIGKIYNVFAEVGQYLPDWRSGKNYRETVSASDTLGGGVLLELSHEFDYLQWLFGELSPYSAILRSSDELSLKVEDVADVVLLGSKGEVISVHLDFLQKKAYRKCRMVGSLGAIEWNLIQNQITLITAKGEELIFDESNLDRNEMYLNVLLDFERKIQGKKQECVTLKEAMNTVILIQKIKSIALKK